MRFKGLTPFNEICFSCFTYTVTIRFNEFKRNELHVSSAVIVTQKMFGYCGGLRAVSLFVNRSAMFVEAVFKSTFGFSYVLFVTVVTLYHVDNVFGVAVVSKFKRKRRVGSGNELVDYSRAPCLGADQKARGLWERD